MHFFVYNTISINCNTLSFYFIMLAILTNVRSVSQVYLFFQKKIIYKNIFFQIYTYIYIFLDLYFNKIVCVRTRACACVDYNKIIVL